MNAVPLLLNCTDCRTFGSNYQNTVRDSIHKWICVSPCRWQGRWWIGC